MQRCCCTRTAGSAMLGLQPLRKKSMQCMTYLKESNNLSIYVSSKNYNSRTLRMPTHRAEIHLRLVRNWSWQSMERSSRHGRLLTVSGVMSNSNAVRLSSSVMTSATTSVTTSAPSSIVPHSSSSVSVTSSQLGSVAKLINCSSSSVTMYSFSSIHHQ